MTPYSNAPSYACRIWFDTQFLYVEFASGLISKFAFTEGALSKVLKLLKRENRDQSPRINGKSKARFPIEPKRAKPEVTKPEAERALELLKRKGLI